MAQTATGAGGNPISDLFVQTLTIGNTQLTETDLSVLLNSINATVVGAAPTVSGLDCSVSRQGNTFTLSFTLTAVSVTVTDAGASGSYGSLKIFDFVQTGVSFLGCRQNYTAFAEGAALTTAAGDAAFVIGVGSAAVAAAANASLSGTSVDVGGSISVTLSGGTGTGTAHTGSTTVIDGTATAADLYLNWSGSAATIDASSTISVTGTIQITGVLLGDD